MRPQNAPQTLTLYKVGIFQLRKKEVTVNHDEAMPQGNLKS